MTTGQNVFDMAIHLMDEQDESTGLTQTADTHEYETRSVDILNVLRHECFPASDNYEVSDDDGNRVICEPITQLSDALDLDDAVAQGALPYGLASRLLLGENDVLANFFEQKFRETLNMLASKRLAGWEDIPEAYGIV